MAGAWARGRVGQDGEVDGRQVEQGLGLCPGMGAFFRLNSVLSGANPSVGKTLSGPPVPVI